MSSLDTLIEQKQVLRLLDAGQAHSLFGARNILRLAVVGDSISELDIYTSASNITDNGDGTYTIGFTSLSAGSFEVGDFPKLLGFTPLNANCRSAEVLARVTGTNGTITVRPDLTTVFPTQSTSMLVYKKYAYNSGSFIHWLCELSGYRIEPVIDAAVGGAAADDIAVWLSRDIIAKAAQWDVVTYCCGMNDIYARGRDLTTVLTQNTANIRALIATGKPVIVVGVPPRNSSAGSWTSGKRDIHNQYNKALQALCQAEGAYYRNFQQASKGTKAYLDATSANGNPTATASIDGVHPGGEGGCLGGSIIVPVVRLLTHDVDILPQAMSETANGQLFVNPFFAAPGTIPGTLNANSTGATMSGTVADSTEIFVDAGSANLTVTASIVARTEDVHGDAIGNAQRLVITTGANAAQVTLRPGGSLHASTTNGDFIRGICAVDITSGASPGSGQPLKLRGAGISQILQTATTGNKSCSGISVLNDDVSIPAHRRIARGPRESIRTPSSTHGAPATVRTNFTILVGANASVCVDIGRYGIYKG